MYRFEQKKNIKITFHKACETTFWARNGRNVSKTWKLKEKCLSLHQQIPPASHKNSVPSGTFFVYRHEIYQTSNDAGTAVLVGSPDVYGMNKELIEGEEVIEGW